MIAIIEISNISKSIGDFTILDDVSLEIPDHTMFSIVGESGAGKSSLINCINRQLEIDSGSIVVDGQDIHALDDSEFREFIKKMAMIFQNYPLMERRTVRRNITLPLECWNYEQKIIDERVEHFAEIVRIKDHLDKYPRELSGGQKQRVAIARALVTQPKYILCDEATSALDPHNSRIIMDLLTEIKHSLDMTIVIVTHDIQLAHEYSDLTAIMAHGKVMGTGVTKDILTEDKLLKVGDS